MQYGVRIDARGHDTFEVTGLGTDGSRYMWSEHQGLGKAEQGAVEFLCTGTLANVEPLHAWRIARRAARKLGQDVFPVRRDFGPSGTGSATAKR